VNIRANIQSFYRQYILHDDRLIFVLAAANLLLGALYITINALWTQFPGNVYCSLRWLMLSPVIIFLYFLSAYAREMSPRIAAITRTYTIYYFLSIAFGLLIQGIQYTPFPLIDKYLVRADLAMGFHSVAVLNWTYAHHWWRVVCDFVYTGVVYQVVMLPLLLGFFRQRHGINIYFVSTLVAYLIGTTIYYFFPTAGPTVMFHDVHFLKFQHDTFIRFFQIHHHLPVTTKQGGMIAFPSYHVIWSIVMAYACRRIKWIFYPVAIFNTLAIASTLFLAWHYLTDVIGGFVVAGISIAIAEWLLRDCLKR